MQALIDLFGKIYNVQKIVELGGMFALVAVVFAETGLLVGFFLPGDSLLVTAGVFCTSANPTQGRSLQAWPRSTQRMLLSRRDTFASFFKSRTTRPREPWSPS